MQADSVSLRVDVLLALVTLINVFKVSIQSLKYKTKHVLRLVFAKIQAFSFIEVVN